MPDVDENDMRVFEDYLIGEDTLQNFEAGRGIVHTPSGRQHGRLYLLEDIEDRLLPSDRLGLRERVWGRLVGQQRQPAIEETADHLPQLKSESGD